LWTLHTLQMPSTIHPNKLSMSHLSQIPRKHDRIL
jgi:hypothetical protein